MEILLHLSQNGYHQEHKEETQIRKKNQRTLIHYRWDVMRISNIEIKVSVPQTLEPNYHMIQLYNLELYIWGNITQHDTQIPTCTLLYTMTLLMIANLEISWVSINGYMWKRKVVYMHIYVCVYTYTHVYIQCIIIYS